MFCSISGELPTDPVVSKVSGHVFERRLILQYLKDPENNSKCPITNEPLSEDDLLAIQTSSLHKTVPRPLEEAASIPSLLSTLQNEWDSLMLETFTLKKHLDTTRKELSQTLYQYDAACRVIARLKKEKEQAQAQLQKVMRNPPSDQVANGMDTSSSDTFGLSDSIQQVIVANAKTLAKARKNRVKDFPDLTTVSAIQEEFACVSSHTLHKSTKPGITCVALKDEAVLSGGMDHQVKLFNTETNQTVATLTGHTDAITNVAFHPASSLVFSSSKDGTVKFWQPEAATKTTKPPTKRKKTAAKASVTYLAKHTLEGHTQAITGFGLHCTGDYVATCSLDESWAMYDVRTGDCISKYQTKDGDSFECLQFHPDGTIMGTGTSTTNVIKMWDINSQTNIATFEGHSGGIVDLSFSENGYHMASAGQDGVVRLWDLRKLKNFKTLETTTPVNAITYDPVSGTYLVVATGNKIQVCHETSKNQWDVCREFEDHTALVTDVAVNATMSTIVSSSMDRSMKVFGQN